MRQKISKKFRTSFFFDMFYLDKVSKETNRFISRKIAIDVRNGIYQLAHMTLHTFNFTLNFKK